MKSNNKRNKAKKVKVAKEINFVELENELRQQNNKYKRNYKPKKSRANKR